MHVAVEHRVGIKVVKSCRWQVDAFAWFRHSVQTQEILFVPVVWTEPKRFRLNSCYQVAL